MPYNLITVISRDKSYYCFMCFKTLRMNNFHELFHKNINICPDCFNALGPIRKEEKINGIKGEYLFSYSNLMREKIYTLKGCGDIELAKSFINYFLFELKIKYRGYYLIAAPSDEASDKERGFNHVVEIFKPLGLPFLNLIHKKNNYKQSDLDKNERMQVINKLMISEISEIKGKKILFVDDISTTGSTLKACLSLIKKGQPSHLCFLIVAKVSNPIEG